ncbi:MAG TPA: SUMF1/EgtB/PvdO family nonheme iron enzyme [Acetobacteraceae bacterium]
MPGFVIALFACAAANCDLTNLEPGATFPTYEACQAELTAKAPSFKDQLSRATGNGRSAQAVCVRESATITDVEEPYSVIDTAIVHSEASASSPFVGIVEAGQKVLVTGTVTGTQWLRVVMADGKSGFVFADHLRKLGGAPPQAAANAPPAPPAPPTPPAGSSTAQNQPPVTPAPAPAQPRGVAPAPRPAPTPAAPMPIPAAPAPPATPPPTAPVRPAAQKPELARKGEFRDCSDCPTMQTLPAGEFEMGSNADPSERPIHGVRIRPFAIANYEVSVAEWQACVDAGGCSYKPAAPDTDPEKRPMTNLSWDDAKQYVAWLAKKTGKPYRLPSEAEWEYAARAGTRTRYSWGEELKPGQADCQGCGPVHDRARPTDLGSFPANPWGLFDMEGNVAEWVEDCWHAYYRGAPTDGAAWSAPNCTSHVLRGGSWNNPPSDITVSSRNFYDGNVRYLGNGLRVALTTR